MRISELTAFHARIPLRKAIRHASYTRDVNDTLIVRCRLDNGLSGFGEGLPRPYVTGETIETAWDQVRSTDWRSQLAGRIDGLADALAVCDRLRLASPDDNGRDCFGNSVRCAVELSVLDAFARAEGVPLSTVTGLVPETAGIRAACDPVRYSAAITSMNRTNEIVRAAALRLYGFQQSKVKVGVAGVDDAAALGRIRRIVGRKIDLRIDANEAWTGDNLPAKLQPILPYGISCVEQPVPHSQVGLLASHRGRLGVPLMLDESLCSLGDAHRAVEEGLCDLFNIRLSKCGGFVNSLRLAAVAHRAVLGYQLGCQVGETGILSAAGRHFATSVAGIKYLEGSYDRHLVKERLTVEDLTFGRGGYAPALTAPGLSVRVDEQALKRVTVAEEHFRIES